jgi:hypothetical protein
MTKSTRLLVTAAALAGLYAGTLALQARADDANPGTTPTKAPGKQNGCNGKTQNSCKAKSSCKGTAKDQAMAQTQDAGKAAPKGDTAKASCSGKNGCSGSTKDSK